MSNQRLNIGYSGSNIDTANQTSVTFFQTSVNKLTGRFCHFTRSRVITKSFCVFSSCALRESTSVSSRSTRIPYPPPIDDVTGTVVRLEVELELELELDISSRASSAESRFVDKLTIGL